MKIEAPFPGPLDAVMLTMTGLFTMAVMVAVVTGPEQTPSGLAMGLGLAIGFGVIGTLAARRVPAPQPQRLGLCGCAPAFAVVVVLLTPTALLASEVDNICRAIWPPSDAAELTTRIAERASLRTPLDTIETWLLAVGLVPVIEEWFFRGVVQQGLVARLGSGAGLVATALLFGVSHALPGSGSTGSLLALAASASLFGWVFGLVRLASGSLLPAIALHAMTNALGLLGMDFVDQLSIPGFNAPGDHTPAGWLVAAAISTGIGIALCHVLADRPPLPAASPEESAD